MLARFPESGCFEYLTAQWYIECVVKVPHEEYPDAETALLYQKTALELYEQMQSLRQTLKEEYSVESPDWNYQKKRCSIA